MNKVHILRYDPSIDKISLRELILKFEEEVEFKRKIHPSEKDRIHRSIDAMFENFENDKGTCYVASWNNYILGFLTLHEYNNSASEIIKPGDIEFSKAYLHPKARGKGIGYALNNQAIYDIKQERKEGMNYNRIISTIENTQTENIRLKTEKFGFRLIANSTYNSKGRIYSTYAKRLR